VVFWGFFGWVFLGGFFNANPDVRTPASVLLDLIIFRTITGLSQEEVCSGVSYVLFNHI